MPCPLEKADIRVLSVETAMSNLIPPQEEYTQHVWFKQETDQALQRLRIKKGNSPWIKAYTWNENGVSRLKIQPKHPSDVNKKPEKWKKTHKSFYPFPKKTRCQIISEPTLLFHLLSRIDTKKTRFPLELCIFGKKELHRVIIRLMRLEPLKVSFESYGLQGTRRIEKNVTPLVFFISEPPSQDKKKREQFSLLGLRDEIFIFVDPKTRLPVRLMGKTSKFGHIVLALTGAWLK